MMAEATLARFVTAQAPVWETVLGELRAGRKRSHWMWFVFPQLRGLGRSEMAWRYGIAERDEAAAYLAHDLLGPRLVEATALVLATKSDDPVAIFGEVDALKFRSCMTLFAAIEGSDAVFGQALARFHCGQGDEATRRLLGVA